jgi:hypothetical protein
MAIVLGLLDLDQGMKLLRGFDVYSGFESKCIVSFEQRRPMAIAQRIPGAIGGFF